MADERADLDRGRSDCQCDCRALACFPCDPLRAILLQPGAPGDKTGKRFGQLGDERLAGRRRDVIAPQQRLADRRRDGRDALRSDRSRTARWRHRGFSTKARQETADPTSAIAADTARGSGARLAMASCTCAHPVATRSTRSASSRSGERSSTGTAISGWSPASACTIAGGAFWLDAKTSARARRTSGEGSSSRTMTSRLRRRRDRRMKDRKTDRRARERSWHRPAHRRRPYGSIGETDEQSLTPHDWHRLTRRQCPS